MALRFGLFGTGHWARHTHAAALAAHPDVKLVGVWGRDAGRAHALAADFGATGYTDVDELIAAVDAVAIALPPQIQAHLAERAARAGRHLLLDKPLALTVADADAVVAAAAATGVCTAVFFTRRYHPAIDEFLTAAASRSWDGAQATMFASIFHPGNPYGASPWRREHGGLWDVGPHALSVVLPVLGPVDEVLAVAGPRQTSHLLLRHSSGAVSTLALTLDAPPAATASEVVFYGADGRVPLPTPDPDRTNVVAFGTAVSQLVANAERGITAHPCDVQFGREVVAVLARAEAAIATTGR